MDAALPPYDGDHDKVAVDETNKPAPSLTSQARLVLAIGLVLELSATIWAFQQAVSAGSLTGNNVDCSYDSRLSTLYRSSLVKDGCDGQVDGDAIENFADIFSREEYGDCYVLTNTVDTLGSFANLCACEPEGKRLNAASCSWVALSRVSGGICSAEGVTTDTNSSDGTITWKRIENTYFSNCWGAYPFGTLVLPVTALLMALCSQLLPAFKCLKHWKDSDISVATIYTQATSVYATTGVIPVAWMLSTYPGGYGDCDEAFFRAVAWLVWAVFATAAFGVLVESAENSDRAARICPYVGAVGNGIVWLGVASLEVVVTSYLLLAGAGVQDSRDLVREVGGLIALELLALVTMLVARGLWTRAMILRSSVKVLEGPLKPANSTPFE